MSDNIIGLDNAETLTGNENSNAIWANGGSDLIFGNGGNDTIWGGSQDNSKDTIDGGSGNDLLGGDGGADSVIGGTGNDTIWGWDGNDTLRGDDGDDVIGGDTGDDTINAGDGDDAVFGHDGNDTVKGGRGADFIVGDETDSPDVSVKPTIKVTGINLDGASSDVSFNDNSGKLTLGENVKGSRYNNEIDFDVDKGSEKLVVDFGSTAVKSASVLIDLMAAGQPNPGDKSQELGTWKAFDANGNEVGTGEIKGTPNLKQTLDIDPSADFSRLEFTSRDNGDGKSDNSDYLISEINYVATPVGASGFSDLLYGETDDDIIFGMTGADTMDGGQDSGSITVEKGDYKIHDGDTVTGGNGADVFIHVCGEGVDTFTDFKVGVDTVLLVGFSGGFDAAVKNNLFQDNDGVVFRVGDTHGILFQGLSVGDLSASDFIFA
jgi:hypothetical protein